MAFPMDGMHLLAHLRTVCLIMADNDQDIKPVIKAVKVKDAEEDVFKYVSRNLQASPPIAFDLEHQMEKREKEKSNGLFKSERVSRKHRRGSNSQGSWKRSGTDGGEQSVPTSVISLESPSVEGGQFNGTNIANTGEKGTTARSNASEVSPVSGKPSPESMNTSRWRSNSRLEETQPNHQLGQIEEEISYESIDDDLTYFDDSTGLALHDNTNEDDIDELSTLDSGLASVNSQLTRQVSLNTIKHSGEDVGDIESRHDSGRNGSASDQQEKKWIPEELQIIDDANITDEEDDDDDDDDDEDDEDEDDEDGEITFYSDDDDSYSSDSAFTDIETDSLLNSSLMLNSYDINASTDYLLEANGNYKGGKKGRKKKISSTFGLQSLSKEDAYAGFKRSRSQSLINGEDLPNASIQGSASTNFSSSKSSSNQHDNIKFEKVNIENVLNKHKSASNLSQMIRSRTKVNITNPLNFYTFVQSASENETDSCAIDVFVPPQTQPTLKSLLINDKTTVVDVIGYILLNLSSLKEFIEAESDLSFMNPNRWRLELVDEDGENYGSFGILDRTRIISSYNNPRELAICKVESEREFDKNEAQSPLPAEFKQGMLALRNKNQTGKSLPEQGTSESPDDSEGVLEIKILGLKMTMNDDNNSLFDTIFIPRKKTVQDLIDEICVSNGFKPQEYQLKLVYYSGAGKKSDTKGFNVNDMTIGAVVEGNSLIGDLTSTTLKIEKKKDSDLGHEKFTSKIMSQIGITPSASTYSASIITPTNGNLDEGNINSALSKTIVPEKGEKKQDASVKSQKNPSKDIFTGIGSSNYLNDMISGKNLLPTNLNTIYFKWNIYRKKTTILNKIEKSLIIDGDYIHLAPPDDIGPNNTTSDATFFAHGASSSHHIHHYNYNNYYKESLMKTTSFHITQIVKMKQYKHSKHPNHFKIVISKSSASTPKESSIKKKYDLEALNATQCQEIMDKIKWVSQIYNQST